MKSGKIEPPTIVKNEVNFAETKSLTTVSNKEYNHFEEKQKRHVEPRTIARCG